MPGICAGRCWRFRRAGFDPVPWPVRTSPAWRFDWTELMPRTAAWETSYLALHEWIGFGVLLGAVVILEVVGEVGALGGEWDGVFAQGAGVQSGRGVVCGDGGGGNGGGGAGTLGLSAGGRRGGGAGCDEAGTGGADGEFDVAVYGVVSADVGGGGRCAGGRAGLGRASAGMGRGGVGCCRSGLGGVGAAIGRVAEGGVGGGSVRAVRELA